MRTSIFAVALAVALAGCETSRAEDMSGEDLKALLANGLPMKLGGPGEGYTGEVKLEADGTGAGSAVLDDGTKLDITGTWEVVGNQFCRKWAFDDFKRTCETWRKLGPNKAEVFVDGKRIGVNSW